MRISYGSSGNLTRQIIQGAPFEVLLSADLRYARALQGEGLTAGPPRAYAVGRLVLFLPRGSSLLADPSLDDLGRALTDGRLERLALANPEHAPYGRAAREALEDARLWRALQGRMLLGESVAQAAQFTVSGDVDAGIISLSTALRPAVAAQGVYALLPESRHRPVSHYMALIKGAGPVAREFHDYLGLPAARGILQKFGFSPPPTGQ